MIRNKEGYVLKIIEILEKSFGQVRCPLNFSNHFELLVAVILSAQCRDEKVNGVTKDLFARYRSIEDYANANISDFENHIRSIGFFRNKAKNIIRSAQLIISTYNGIVPQKMEELLKLHGVARKTANVILNVGFNKSEGIAVDTHVMRIAKLLKLTKHSDPTKIEKDLMNVVPQKYWTGISFYIQTLGKRICKARNPNHSVCPLNSICLAVRGTTLGC